jgi:hypothetical protein
MTIVGATEARGEGSTTETERVDSDSAIARRIASIITKIDRRDGEMDSKMSRATIPVKVDKMHRRIYYCKGTD